MDSATVYLSVTVSSVGDVNDDGVPDLVARLDCLFEEPSTYLTQLVAYNQGPGQCLLEPPPAGWRPSR